MDRQKRKNSSATLQSVLNQSIERKEQAGHFRTAANYRSSMNKLAAYLGDSFRHFTFTGLTARWVEEYVGWLAARHPESPGTAEFYLRNLRAMCRSHRERHRLAWAEGSDPFSGAGFRTQPTSKRALPAGALAGLFSPELRERLDASRRESLDVLHFILFMRGMVFQDVWNLRHEMIGGDGHIRYRRSKTGILIDVEIPPEAEAIINRYFRDGSPYVFPFLHHRKGRGSNGKDGGEEKAGSLPEESALRRVNRHAVEIGKLAGLSAPLTTYVLRHTWATLMLEAGYSVELIGQLPGPYLRHHHPHLPVAYFLGAGRYGSGRDVQPPGASLCKRRRRPARAFQTAEREAGQAKTKEQGTESAAFQGERKVRGA